MNLVRRGLRGVPWRGRTKEDRRKGLLYLGFQTNFEDASGWVRGRSARFNPTRSSAVSRDTIHVPGFQRTAYQEVGGNSKGEKGEKMENSMLSAASGPFVTRHAPKTAFARHGSRNSWNLGISSPRNQPGSRRK